MNGCPRIGMLLAVTLLSAACGSSRPAVRAADPQLSRDLEAARAAHAQGLDAQAANLFDRAADRAYLRDDLPAAMDAHYSRAICLMRLQRYDEAATELYRAEYAAQLADRPVDDNVIVLRARVAYMRGELDEAKAQATRIIDSPTAKPQAVSDAWAVVGLIAAARDDTEATGDALRRMGEPISPHGQAEHARLSGMLANLEDRPDDAAQAFDREAELRRATRAYATMARALAAAAEAYEKLGRLDAAAVRYLRAGRSAAQQSMPDEAERWLTQAARLADEANDAATAAAAHEDLQRLGSEPGADPSTQPE